MPFCNTHRVTYSLFDKGCCLCDSTLQITPGLSADPVQCNHRFLTECLELYKSCGGTTEEALELVDYVSSRPVGVKSEKADSAIIMFAALGLTQGFSVETEPE